MRVSFVLLLTITSWASPCLAQLPLPGLGEYDVIAEDVTVVVGESFSVPVHIETSIPVNWLGLYVTNDLTQCQPTTFEQGAGVLEYENQNGPIPCDVGISLDHVYVAMGFVPVPYDSGIYGTELAIFGYQTTATEPGTTTVVILDGYTMEPKATVTVTIVDDGGEFVRGDANGDGTCNLPDVVTLLQLVFVAGESSDCWDSADINDDGALGLADGIALLSSLFVAGAPEIPVPSAACGADPTADDLPPCGTSCP